ncbi:MAG: ATP-binding cassette domain-containing protein [Leptospiraceae bacterium]|nr:ATP-binding cassette domain-containing protein [Leptospiraceae bacterium]MCB1315684.1 ATP-binding cassette domain-containing protein [Leptospiraceae bacterium]
MIQVANLRKDFGDFTAVDGINFSIDRDSGITALLGPNGAGKTTTMRLITGYLEPTDGQIAINNTPITDDASRVEMQRHIGYLPESTPLYPEMLVSEYLAFMGQVRGLATNELSKRAAEMIEALELGSHLYSPLGILSKGFRQRAALAATLIHNPDVIILDEPTSGLDPNQIIHIRSIIKNLGSKATVVLSTHILQEVEDICDRVIIINRGRIVADESAHVLRNIGVNQCRISVRGENVAATLEKLPLVTSCRAVKQDMDDQPEGYALYECELTESAPEKLFRELAQLNWEVRELAPATRSLQEVFQEFTR